MAPKNVYTTERMRKVAATAMAKAKEKFQDCIITCAYAEGEERLTQRSEVSFEWYVKVSGYEEKLTIQLKCENASARGVRFPESWNTSIECARLGKAKIESSIEELKKDSPSVVAVALRMLGCPKPSPPPSLGTTLLPGAVAQLQTRTGARQDYLLAAHIDGDRHRAQSVCSVGATRCTI